jgi:hypothetical protein
VRPVSVLESAVDTGTSNGFGAVLRLLDRRNDMHRLPSPVSLSFIGAHGVVVQFGANEAASVRAWAKAFKLPEPTVEHLSSLDGRRWNKYVTRGSEFRLRIEIWCVTTEFDRGASITDANERQWA